ncbi:MAG: hypothetical protein HDS38_08710 [Bacteroides sp.]|nr:hypothetical protein [Bacteroides sp.]
MANSCTVRRDSAFMKRGESVSGELPLVPLLSGPGDSTTRSAKSRH